MCELTLGSETRRSFVRMNTLEPRFGERFFLKYFPLVDNVLSFAIVNWNRGKEHEVVASGSLQLR